MVDLGLSESSIAVAGFPVHPIFRKQRDRQIQCRQELGLADNLFTILAVGGRAGAGIKIKLIKQIVQISGVQVLVVTGENEVLRHKILRATSNPSCLHTYGWVDNMHTLMGACDVVVTKAGPSTILEAASMEKPVIITSAIGVQELGNIQMVLDRQWGFFCSTTTEVLQEVARVRSQGGSTRMTTKDSDYCGAYQIARMLINFCDSRVSICGG
jgi:UDP-N-acetylglucosamine:LPS N-acetylglucosamine transferase